MANPFGISQIVTARARKIVLGFLDHFLKEKKNPLHNMTSDLEALRQAGDSLVAAFAEAMMHDEPMKRLTASYFIVKFRESDGRHASDEAERYAREVILDALKSNDHDLSMAACSLLSNLERPAVSAIEYIRPWLASNDKWQATRAAAALSKSSEEPDAIAAHGVLHRALGGDDEELAALAGCALFSENSTTFVMARHQVARILPELSPYSQYHILVQMKQKGIVEKEFFDVMPMLGFSLLSMRRLF